MFETKSGVFLIAGLFFFAIAFLGNAVVPIVMYRDMPELKTRELVNDNLMDSFRDLQSRYPEQFKKYIGEATEEKCAEILSLGKKVYVGEACWHCHSQFIRPVSREAERWGPVAKSWEYQNELQKPVLFGTRRVGPDLSREAGRRSNDWHAVHFHKPKSTSPYSVMPDYEWFFDADPDKPGETSPNLPNKRGIAIMVYMQWLGSWLAEYPLYEAYDPTIDRPRPYTSKQRPPEETPEPKKE